MKTSQYSMSGEIFLSRRKFEDLKSKGQLVQGAKYYIIDDATVQDLISGVVPTNRTVNDELGRRIIETYVIGNDRIEPNTSNYIFPSYGSNGLVTGSIGEAIKRTFFLNGIPNSEIFISAQMDNSPIVIYSPENIGTSGDILQSNGEKPVWVSLESIIDNATIVKNTDNTLSAVGLKTANGAVLSAETIEEALTMTITAKAAEKIIIQN